MVIFFIVLTLDIRLHIAGLMKQIQTREYYVDPHDIECYKCHNNGHIARYYRSMMDTSLGKKIDIKYKKVWKRKQEQVKEY